MNLNEIKKLRQKKYRREFGFVFMEGLRFAKEAEASKFKNYEVICTKKYESFKSRFEKKIIDELQFQKISDVENPQGIGILLEKSQFNLIPKSDSAIFLDRIQDPGNLGTIIRTMAWFGNYSLYLSKGTVDPFSPKVLRSSAGGHFHVRIHENIDFFKLKNSFNEIVIFEPEGKILNPSKVENSLLLVFGNEGNGVSKKILNANGVKRFQITGSGNIESLNVSSTVSIVLHYYSTMI